MTIFDKIFSRRGFLKAMAFLGTVLFGGCSLKDGTLKGAVNALDNTALTDAEFVRQIITQSSKASRTIMWQSAAPQKEAVVCLREKASGKLRSFPAESTPYHDDGQKLHLHTVAIKELAPGKEYEYRLQDGSKTTGWYRLNTDDGKSFTAVIFPDSQCNDYSVWERNARAALSAHPEAAFFVNLGDLVDNGEDHSQWDAWFSAVEDFICHIPFVPVMGNHETYDRKWQVRLPSAYLAEFAVPPNGSGSFNRCYYSFEYGDAYFAVLNTQWDEIGEFKDGLWENELDWLRADVHRHSKKWKIALLHKDVLRYAIKNRPERTAGISEAGQRLMPVLEELGFEVVLTAHLHTYRNRGRLRDFAPDESGPLYLLAGNAGNIFYNDFWLDHPLDRVKAPQPEGGNYLLLQVAKDTLTIKSCLINGECFDETVLSKKAKADR